jgi:hypothetical protein
MILIEYKVESEYNQTTQRASAWVMRRVTSTPNLDEGEWTPVQPFPRCEAACGLVMHERAAVKQMKTEIANDAIAAKRLGIAFVCEDNRIALHPPPADPHVQSPRAKHIRRSP